MQRGGARSSRSVGVKGEKYENQTIGYIMELTADEKMMSVKILRADDVARG